MHTAEIDNIAGLLKAMAHPIRLKILCLLREKEMSVGDLQATIQTTNGNISQHLTILRNQEIITCRKDANFIFNRIADPRVMQLMECLQSLFCCTSDHDGPAQ